MQKNKDSFEKHYIVNDHNGVSSVCLFGKWYSFNNERKEIIIKAYKAQIQLGLIVAFAALAHSLFQSNPRFENIFWLAFIAMLFYWLHSLRNFFKLLKHHAVPIPQVQKKKEHSTKYYATIVVSTIVCSFGLKLLLN